MYGNQCWTSNSLLSMGVGLGNAPGRSTGVGGGNLSALVPNSLGRSNFLPGRVVTQLGSISSNRPATFTEGKLFLGGLDSSTTKETLLTYCSQWGEITDAVVMEGRGFGFITFQEPKNAQKFLENRSHTIDGKGIEAKAAVPKGVGSGSNLTKKLFVGGTGELTDEDFREYFSRYGEIQDAVIVRKQDGTSRGFGFVTFADEMTVEKCLVIQHELKGRKVDLRRAVPREQMATQQVIGVGGVRSGFGLNGFGGPGINDMTLMGYSMAGYGMPAMSTMPNYNPYGRSPIQERGTQRYRPY